MILDRVDDKQFNFEEISEEIFENLIPKEIQQKLKELGYKSE